MMAIRSTAHDQTRAHNPYYRATRFSTVKAFFGNYVNFSGRSARAEFWWPVLLGVVVSILYAMVLLVGTVGIALNGKLPAADKMTVGWLIGTFGAGLIVYLLLMLVVLIPSLALIFRRFRDAGFPWWTFIAFYVADVAAGLLFGTTSSPAQLIGWVVNVATLVIACLPSRPLPDDAQ